MTWLRATSGTHVWIPDNTTTAASTTSSSTLLYSWVTPTSSATTGVYYPAIRRYYYYPYAQASSNWRPRYDAEAAQRALFERERARQAIMFEGHAEAASALADGLLMEHLTPEQRECFKQNKWFVVEGGKSKQKYRICAKDNLIANVDVLEGDSIRHRLCAHADPKAMPLGDHLLAQKMMIEFAEDNFLRVANRHAYHGHA